LFEAASGIITLARICTGLAVFGLALFFLLFETKGAVTFQRVSQRTSTFQD